MAARKIINSVCKPQKLKNKYTGVCQSKNNCNTELLEIIVCKTTAFGLYVVF